MKVPFYTNVVDVKNDQGQFERHLYGLPEQTTLSGAILEPQAVSRTLGATGKSWPRPETGATDLG